MGQHAVKINQSNLTRQLREEYNIQSIIKLRTTSLNTELFLLFNLWPYQDYYI